MEHLGQVVPFISIEALCRCTSTVFLTIFVLFWFASKFLPTNFKTTAMALSLTSGVSNFFATLVFSQNVAFNEDEAQFISNTKWTEWMLTIPLIVLVFGVAFQLTQRRIFVCMISQFLMVFLGYISEQSNVFCFKLVLFLLCIFLRLSAVILFCIIYWNFVSKLNAQCDRLMVLLNICFLCAWVLLPISWVLKFVGFFSLKYHLLCSLFLDTISKLCCLGLSSLLHYHVYTTKQQHGVGTTVKQNKIQTQFLRFMYHELRNPFNTLMLGLDVLEDENQDPECATILSTLKKSAQQMNRVINDAADLSENQGTLELFTQPTDISLLLNSVLQDFETSATDKALTIRSHISNEIAGLFLLDQPKVVKMFRTIISNAIKFSPPCTTVDLFLQVEHIDLKTSKISFSVKDCGPGISEELGDKIFQPFSVVRPGDFIEDFGRGSGLSLCTAKILADLMNADITFSSQKNEGSTFSIFLICERCSTEINKPAGGFSCSQLRMLTSWNQSKYTQENVQSQKYIQDPLEVPISQSLSQAAEGDFTVDRKSTRKSTNTTPKEIEPCLSHTSVLKIGSMQQCNVQDEVLEDKTSQMLHCCSKRTLSSGSAKNSNGNSLGVSGEFSACKQSTELLSTHSQNKIWATESLQIDAALAPKDNLNDRSFFPKSGLKKLQGMQKPTPTRAECWLKEENSKKRGKVFPISSTSPRAMMESFSPPAISPRAMMPRTFCPSPQGTAASKSSFSLPEDQSYEQKFTISDSLEREPALRVPYTQGHVPTTYLSTANNSFVGNLSEEALFHQTQQSYCVEQDDGTPQILIVDDIKFNVKLTSMILKKAGYTCDLAFDGLQAVEMAKKKTVPAYSYGQYYARHVWSRSSKANSYL